MKFDTNRFMTCHVQALHKTMAEAKEITKDIIEWANPSNYSIWPWVKSKAIGLAKVIGMWLLILGPLLTGILVAHRTEINDVLIVILVFVTYFVEIFAGGYVSFFKIECKQFDENQSFGPE